MGIFNQIRIVVPTFNEAENISKLTRVLFDLPIDGLSLLVVDDNSPDGTGQITDELSKSHPGRLSVLHRTGKKGLGSAYIEGFGLALELGADAIVQMDADFSHPPDKVIEMVDSLGEADVALGSRYVSGGSLDEHWPIWRKGLSAFGNVYAKTILQLPVNDATGGFRAWRRETLLNMPLDKVRSNGYAFQVEMIYLAHRIGCKINEVPFYFADRKWGTSKMSFAIQIEAAYRVWQMLFEYRDLKPTVDSKSSSLTL